MFSSRGAQVKSVDLGGFALIKDTDFNPVSVAKVLMWVSLLSLAISAFFGFCCALGRLWDFRGTARRACNHPKAPTKDELRDLGQTTWILLYLQLGAFSKGVIL
jgi:hypothetical protein